MKRSILLVGLVLLAASPVGAAEPSPLAQVPATFPVVVHLRGVERTRQRTLAMVSRAMPKEAQMMLKELEDNLDDVLSGKHTDGRALKGLTKDGSIFLGLARLPEDPSDLADAAVLIVPVQDYATFRDGLLTEEERGDVIKREGYEQTTLAGKPVFFVPRDGYAVVALSRDVAKQLTKKAAGLDGKLDAATAKRMLEADLAVYVDPAAVGKSYGEQLLAIRQTVEQQLTDKDGPLGDSEEMREMIKLFMKGVTQFFRDSRAFLVTVQAEPDGLKIHAHIAIGRDTATARLLKSQELTALEEIGQMPVGQASFSAVKPASGSEANEIMNAFNKLLGGRPGLKEAADLEEAAGVKLVLSGHRDRLGSEGVDVKVCTDPEKMVQSILKNYENLKEGDPADGNLILAEKPVVKTNAEKHRGFTFHRASLTYDLDKSAKGQNVDAAFLRRQLGGDDGNVWFGTDGKTYVELKARTWGGAKQHLDTYLDRGDDVVGKSAAFKAARKQLPDKVSFLFMEETTIYSQLMVDYAASQAKQIAPRVPRPKANERAYWGAAVTLQPEQVSMDLWVAGRVFHDYIKALGGGR